MVHTNVVWPYHPLRRDGGKLSQETKWARLQPGSGYVLKHVVLRDSLGGESVFRKSHTALWRQARRQTHDANDSRFGYGCLLTTRVCETGKKRSATWHPSRPDRTVARATTGNGKGAPMGRTPATTGRIEGAIYSWQCSRWWTGGTWVACPSARCRLPFRALRPGRFTAELLVPTVF